MLMVVRLLEPLVAAFPLLLLVLHHSLLPFLPPFLPDGLPP